MIVYLTRVIPAFVMYCVNGTSRSSLRIESTNSNIYIVQDKDELLCEEDPCLLEDDKSHLTGEQTPLL